MLPEQHVASTSPNGTTANSQEAAATGPPIVACGTTAAQVATDTRLNAAMRALLAIIAGLIVSDILKGMVATIVAGANTRGEAWANALYFLAATAFILRVLTDNVLFYNDPDHVTQDDAYLLRVTLIVCDLTSYALCYGVVARLTRVSSTVVTRRDVVASTALFASVEALHCLWCMVALAAIKTEPETDRRKPLLRTWRSLSGRWSAGWIAAAVLSGVGFRYSGSVWLFVATSAALAILSIASAAHYLRRLRSHYMGRPLAAVP